MKGTSGVATRHTYSGTVWLIIAGIGQAAGQSYSDAFYLYADASGAYLPPENPDEFILTINQDLAQSVITGGRIPEFRDDHIYTVEINAPGGVLTFGIADGFSVDNSGGYSVFICNP